MSFIWPPMLALLALIPIGVLGYRSLDRRRRARAEALSGLGFASGGPRSPARLRSRIPPALFVLGLTVMTVALARPQGTIALPKQEGTVILAFDVSGSMAATDLAPTRMAAAKAAATDFVNRQPSSIAIGVVAFSDSGLSVQAPVTDQGAVLAAINRLSPERGTSLGQGIIASLAAISLAENPPSTNYYSNRSPSPEPSPSPSPVPPGSHGSAVIVLLSDGENNQNPDPLAAAQAAADRGIRIDTVGIGSAAGADLDVNGFHVHTQLDEALLQQVAQLTSGTYFAADTAQDLRSVYDTLDLRLLVKPQQMEVTAILAGAGLLILAIGSVSSLAWLGRLP